MAGVASSDIFWPSNMKRTESLDSPWMGKEKSEWKCQRGEKRKPSFAEKKGQGEREMNKQINKEINR